MVKLNGTVYFVASDKCDGSSKILHKLHERGLSNQTMTLCNLEDDLEFVNNYDFDTYLILCNGPDDKQIPLADRYKCAQTFIKNNNIKDYVFILDL